MVHHLLVPLDTSWEAESSLAVAAPIARRAGAFITLLHVLEPGAAAPGRSVLVHEHEVQEYLARMVRWLKGRGVDAARLVRDALPSTSDTIAAVAAETGADLIVLSSRGAGLAHGTELGRIAREVLVSGTIPFLLVRPFALGREHQFVCRRLLIPLDGSERAEAALPAAHMLAEAFGGEMLLTWVLPALALEPLRAGSAERSSVTFAERSGDDERFARRYLDTIMAGLQWGGITVDTLVARGEPAKTLLETARTQSVDMLVLATHGRTGNPAVWAGSVASRLVDRSECPVLIVRSPR